NTNPKTQTRKTQNLILRRRPMKPLKINRAPADFSRYGTGVRTLQEIEKAIETLSLPERLRLYKDLPQLIGRDIEDLDWQRFAIEHFFSDDSPEDAVYDQV
ncbi:MAG: hypothetical protein ACYDH9_19760, partial [Limisphaerales bacterium]